MSSFLLSSSGETLSIPHAVKILSVAITNETAGGLELSIYPYQDTAGKPMLKIAAGADVSSQLLFTGLPLSMGFTAVPETGLTFYIIEYEQVNNQPQQTK